MTLRERLLAHDNNYSHLEPFTKEAPITSSIVVPTYNEVDIFNLTLQNLEHHPEINAHPELFEVIIVNDGSTEDVDGVLQSKKFPCRLNYLKFTTNQGRSKARNNGIHLSHNDLVFILDSDVLLPHNYFRGHWKVHNASKKIIAAGFAENIDPETSQIERLIRGENILPEIEKDFRFYTDVSRFAAENDKGVYYMVRETDRFREFGHQLAIGMWTLPWMVVSHNMSVRRDNLIQVGCFDERFRGWGCEDTHLGAKLIGIGCYVVPVLDTGAFRLKHPPRHGTEKSKRREMLANIELYEKLIDEEYS